MALTTYKKMYNKVTVGGPESTLGTAVARDARLPLTGLAVVKETPSKASNDVISGRGAIEKHHIDYIDVGLELPMQLEACKGIGKALVSLLGKDLATPQQVIGAIAITYQGSEDSCKLVVDDTGQSITSSIGDLESEAVDAAFGAAGVIDLTAAANDTIAELVSVIDAYSNYSCEKLFGSAAADATSPMAITAAQGKGRSVIVYFTGTSEVYLHRFTPIMTNQERPTLTFQGDNTGPDNDVLSGGVVDSATIAADLKGRASMNATVIGTKVETASESSVVLPTSDPMKFSSAAFYLAGIKHCYTKSISIEMANNHDGDEGFCAGSLRKGDHSRGMFDVKGSVSVRTDTDSETERAKRLTEAVSSLMAMFVGKSLATDINEMVLVKLPAVDVMDTGKSESGVSIDTEFTLQAIDENSYDDFVVIDMLTKDSAKYN